MDRRLIARAVACSLSLLASTAVFALDRSSANSLWVGDEHGVLKLASTSGDILLELPGLGVVRATQVDMRRQKLWVLTDSALRAFDFAGTLLFSLSLPLPSTTAADIAVAPGDGSVWVAANQTLVSVSSTGQHLFTQELPGNVVALDVDPRAAQLWVATDRTLRALDLPNGDELRSIPIVGSSRIHDARIDPATGNLWLALRDEVRVYGSGQEPLLSVAYRGAERIAPTGDGGAWVATAKTLSRLDGLGATGMVVEPFAGAGNIGALLVAGNRSVWIANATTIGHLSPDGFLLHQLSFQPPIRIRDLATNSDWVAPEIEIIAPTTGSCLPTLVPSFDLAFEDSGWGVDAATLALTANSVLVEVSCSTSANRATCTVVSPLPEGATTFSFSVSDYAGNISTTTTVTAKLDLTAPQISVVYPADGATTPESTAVISGSINEVAILTINGSPVVVGGSGGFVTSPLSLEEGENIFDLRASDCAGNVATKRLVIIFQPVMDDDLPPDPAEVAPPTDPKIAPDFYADTKFLFEGNPPIQSGIQAGAIDPARIAVLRGRVLHRDGSPFPNVTIRAVSQSQLGQTLTRQDGEFDFAVNGGGLVTVELSAEGFLSAHRTVAAPLRDFRTISDVVLVALDPIVTNVTLGFAAAQVARGTATSDDAGSRRATLIVPPATNAELVFANGSRQAVSAVAVRATEYTVGPHGHASMPAPLPANSGYTYAVELSADEALASGASRVAFSQPIYHYVENFLHFPVGGTVPVGYYDREKLQWLSSVNGRVIRILAIEDGKAAVDVEGTGQPATTAMLATLGFSEAELRALEGLYSVGQELWRTPIPHFTPWDCNWPYGPPEDAEEPPPQEEDATPDPDTDGNGEPDPSPGGGGEPPVLEADNDKPAPVLGRPDCVTGSVIECQNQILRESLHVSGTPYKLHYSSARVPGHTVSRSLRVHLSGQLVPSSLKRIDLEIEVAGRRIVKSFAPNVNQEYTFVWDQRDAYGRLVQGFRPVHWKIGYVYPAVYYEPDRLGAAFGAYSPNGTIAGSRGRSEIVLWRDYEGAVGGFEARALGFGGWTLGEHHYYDVSRGEVFAGDGTHRLADTVDERMLIGRGTQNLSQGGTVQNRRIHPLAVGVGPDGSVTFVNFGSFDLKEFWQIRADGRTYRMGGSIASWAAFGDMAVASNGDIYYTECQTYTSLWRTRRLPSGGIRTDFLWWSSPDKSIECVGALAIGPDGSVYMGAGTRLLRYSSDGSVAVIAGNGTSDTSTRAATTRIHTTRALAVAPDGSVYFAEDTSGSVITPRSRIRVIRPDGSVSMVAGGAATGYGGDGGPALSALFGWVAGLAVSKDGSLLVVDYLNNRIRRITTDGLIFTVIGNGSADYAKEVGFPTTSSFPRPISIAEGPNGTLYVVSQQSSVGGTIWAFPSPLAGQIGVSSRIVAPGGTALEFDAQGRHLRTLDTISGVTLTSFRYGPDGLVSEIFDVDGNVTRIARNGGRVVFTAPFGQETALTLGTDGYLAQVELPGGLSRSMTYATGGLLRAISDFEERNTTFAYSTGGRLVRETDPVGGFKLLERRVANHRYRVDLTASDRGTRSYAIWERGDGHADRTTELPWGGRITLRERDGWAESIDASGTITVRQLTADPRFGLQEPILQREVIRTPSGLTRTVSFERTLSLAIPGDPWSLQWTQDKRVVNGRTYSLLYDAGTRSFTYTTPAGRTARAVVDQAGRAIRVESAGVAAVERSYDEHGRLGAASQGQGESRRLSLTYRSTDGFLGAISDSLNRTVSFDYDADGRVVAQSLPGGRSLSFGYDANGNLTEVVPPSRSVHRFEYNAVDGLTRYSPPDLGTGPMDTTFEYDLDRKLTRIERPDGKAIDAEYDPAGRLAALRSPSGDMSYHYATATGRMDRIDGPGTVALTYGYDGPLVTGAHWSGEINGSITSRYDADFRVAERCVNGSQCVSFTRDADGLLIRTGALTLTREAATGRLVTTTLGVVTTSQSYSSFGDLASFSARVSGTTIYEYTLSRDTGGRIIGKTETIGVITTSWVYHYDPAGRLERVEKDGVSFAEYTYDVNGNRLAYQGTFGSFSGTHDAQDRLTAYGETAFTYTANGELLTQTQGGYSVVYDYDVYGNLRSVGLPNGIVIEYLVDGLNRRVGKKVNGALTKGWLYKDQLNPIAEISGAGNIVSRFVYGSRPNVPDYMTKDGQTYRIVADHLGSPRLVVNTATGTVAQRMDFNEFGRVILDTNPGFQPIGYAGGLYDYQSGFVRFGARDYAAEVGRWTAKDPVRFSGGQANLYQYVFGDPVNSVDSTGLSTFYCGLTASAAWPLTGGAGLGGEAFAWIDTKGNYGYAYGVAAGGGAGTPSIGPVVGLSLAPTGTKLSGPGGQGGGSVGPGGGSVTRSGTDYWGVELLPAGFGAFAGETYTWVEPKGNIVEDFREFGDDIADAAQNVWDTAKSLFDPDTYNPWADPEGTCPCDGN